MAISFFVDNKSGFNTATTGFTSVGVETFEESTLGANQIQSFDNPLKPGVANGPFTSGTLTAVGVTVQSNTLGDAPAHVSPNANAGALTTASAGFASTPDDQVSTNDKDDSFDIIIDPPGLAPVTAVNFVPLYFGATPGDTDTLTVRAYDASDNLIGTQSFVGGDYVNEKSFIGIVGTGGSSIYRININDGTAVANDFIGADDIAVFTGSPNTPPVANDDSIAATEAGGTANNVAGNNPSGNLILGTGSGGAVQDTDAQDASSALKVVAVHTGPEGASVTTGTVGSDLIGAHGTLKLNADGSYTYLVNQSDGQVQALASSADTLTDKFNYTIEDTGGSQDTASVTFTIHGANDAPDLLANAGFTLNEGATRQVLSSDLTYTDPEQLANALTYTVRSISNGTLVLGANTVLGVNSTFTQDDIDLGRIKFTHDGSETTTAGFGFSLSDGHGGDVTGQSFDITVNAVNDAPTATITAVSYNATEQVSLDLKNNGMSVSDIDGKSGNESVTLSATEGTLTIGVGSSGVVIDSGNGTDSVTFHGTIAQINDLLNTNGTSSVSYIDNSDNPSSNATLTLTIHDNGNTGGGDLSDSDTATINIGAVNDDPVATSVPSDVAVIQDTASNIDLSAMSFSDADSGANAVTFTLSADTGTLAATSGGSVIVSGSGTDSLTLTGTAANIDAFLNTASNIQYTGPSGLHGDNAATLTLSANDGGHTGTGGGTTVTLGTVHVDIQEQRSFTVTTLSDVVDAFDGKTSLREALDYANSHAGVDTITFATGAGTIRLTNAAGSLVASEGVIINGDINNDKTPDITITGDVKGNDDTVAGGITDVFTTSKANLSDNIAIIYSTGTADLTFNGVVLTGGSTGSGGAINSAGDLTLTNSIVNGNQSSAAGGAISVTDDATLTNVVLSGNQSVNDTGGGILVINGKLDLTDSTVSGNSANGDGGGISAAEASILHSTISDNSSGGLGGGILVYGDADVTASTFSGNTAIFGGGLYANDADLTNATFSGNTAAVSGGGIYTNLDAAVTNSTITGNDGKIGGIDANSGTLTNSIVMGNNGIQIAGFTTPIVLTGGNIVGTDVYSGGSDVGDTTLADVFANVGLDPHTNILSGVLANNGGKVLTVALNADTVNPALDASDGSAPATDSRDFGRLDHGDVTNGTGGNGADLGAFEAQNVAPDGTDNTITIDEDEDDGFGYEFSSADFGFKDTDGDNYESVVISSLPLNGVLFNDITNKDVQVGDVIDVADIDNGALFFIPDPDENGKNYANFKFTVVDDGDTLNGGSDTDQLANTITFDVTPVNDAPRIVLQPSLDVVAGSPDSDSVGIALNLGGFLFPGSEEFTGNGPRNVALADLDGNGLLDIITSNFDDGTVTILLQETCGCFEEPTGSPITVGKAPGGIAVGLINNDLIPDLVIANTGDNTVSALIGNGDGTFTKSDYAIATLTTVADVALADFNEDGKLDIVMVGTNGVGNVEVALGDGAGGFSYDSDQLFGTHDFTDVEAVDVDGDKHVDIVAVDRLNDQVWIYNGNGKGDVLLFLPRLATGDAPEDAAVGDVNGDGRLDIVVANSGDNTVGVFLGKVAAGTFASQVTYATEGAPATIALADMDGDGNLDIVAGGSEDDGKGGSLGTFEVLLGKGDGTFASDPFPLVGGFGVSGIAVGNIDKGAEDQNPLFKLFTEGDTLKIVPHLELSDIDSTKISGAAVIVADGLAGDVLSATGTAGIKVDYDPSTFTLTLSSTTPQDIADYQQVLRSLTFSSGDNPDDFGNQPTRTIEMVVDDGGLDGVALSAPIGVFITAVDDAPQAFNDQVIAKENAILSGSVFANNGSGADADPDGPAIGVISVNGAPASVGTQIALASGALLTLNANGTFSYNPNHVFDNLPDFAASGASNTVATDSFSYKITGGGAAQTATVTVAIRGVDSNDLLQGTGAADNLNGGIGNDTVNAGNGNDTIRGGSGSDLIDGGAGADRAFGGAGDDVYVIDNANDEADESVAGSGGADLVKSASVSIELGNTGHFAGEIENATLEGSANLAIGGNGFANVITGNSGSNGLAGRAGNDTIDGGLGADNISGGDDNDRLIGGGGNDTLDGGAGADKVFGGAGDDTYIIDSLDDEAHETLPGSDGIDTVRSAAASIELANNGHFTGGIENATLEGSANLAVGGNGLANAITGNDGNNGLAGRAGNDTIDGGQGADNISGGDDNDVLFGGAGNDTLDGGSGADKAFGGAGDDTYIIDSLDDEAHESLPGSDGIDTVRSSAASINLANLGHFSGKIENAALDGSGNLNAIGNDLANKITGNAGSNVIDGGLGADTMTGFGGTDSFRFSAVLGGANADVITDYSIANDTIILDHTVFAGLAAGALNANAFHIGAAAHDLDDRIIYNAATGQLSFDADGNLSGGVSAIPFATLTNGLAMTATEFLIV